MKDNPRIIFHSWSVFFKINLFPATCVQFAIKIVQFNETLWHRDKNRNDSILPIRIIR